MEEKLVFKLNEIFNGLAKPTVEAQKRVLGIQGEITKSDYLKLVERLKIIFTNVAGEVVAKRIYDDLVRLAEVE